MLDRVKRWSVGLVQMRCEESRERNFEHAREMVSEAARKGAEIICLPELFTSRYFCQTENHAYFAWAEEIPGPTSEKLSKLAKDLSVTIIGSLFEKRMAGLFYNTAVVFDRTGALLGKYRKMHIPDDPLYYEKFYFAPGDLGFQAWRSADKCFGVCICWDQWYPEAARLTALRGAGVLFYPTAIGWHPAEKEEFGLKQYRSWQTIQRSHAIANGCFVAVPNRIGREYPDGDLNKGEGIEFWGGSFLCDPSGEILLEASHDKEEVLVREIDLNLVDIQRTHWPFLRDRRIDAYEGIHLRSIPGDESSS